MRNGASDEWRLGEDHPGTPGLSLMPAAVVNASVLAALAFDELQGDAAAKMLTDVELVAPRLLAYELTHLATKKRLLRPDQADQIEVALWRALYLITHWADVGHLSVYRLASSETISAYDASYLWASRSRSLPLITFDRRLQKTNRQ